MEHYQAAKTTHDAAQQRGQTLGETVVLYGWLVCILAIEAIQRLARATAAVLPTVTAPNELLNQTVVVAVGWIAIVAAPIAVLTRDRTGTIVGVAVGGVLGLLVAVAYFQRAKAALYAASPDAR